MNYQQFVHIIKTNVEHLLGDNYHVELYTTLKNNSKSRTGLTISKVNSNISPTIYLEEFYEEYLQEQDINSIPQTIVELYYDIKLENEWRLDVIHDFESVKSNLVYRIINTSRNEAFLTHTPHKNFLNFSIIFYLLIEVDYDRMATITISNEIMSYWKTSVDELYAIARQNMPILLPAKFQPMHEVIKELMGDVPLDLVEPSSMYVLTNPMRTFGASCILYDNMLENIRDILKEDYYLIPGSIHEMIIVPASISPSKEHLKNMLSDVNESQNPLEDILSDDVYYYEHKSKSLS